MGHAGVVGMTLSPQELEVTGNYIEHISAALGSRGHALEPLFEAC